MPEKTLKELLYKFECYHKRNGVTDKLRSILVYTVGDNTENFIEKLTAQIKALLRERIEAEKKRRKIYFGEDCTSDKIKGCNQAISKVLKIVETL